MTALRSGYHGLAYLASLNTDRLLYGATIAVALLAGSFFGTLFL